MTNEERIKKFRKWRDLVRSHPKDLRIKSTVAYTHYEVWLEQYINNSYWYVIDYLPSYDVFKEEIK